MLAEQTARNVATASESETSSSSGSAQSYENLKSMSENNSQTQSVEQPTAGVAHKKEETHMDDFAAALESYTLETEPAPSEDNVFKGTVIKITATHVVVDIGFKSEGLVPIAEVTDAHGNVKFEPGQEIEVMVQRGENEEGSVLLSHERAERVRVWENIEKAYHSKEPVKGTVVERVKGGVSVDIGVKAFMPGSQVDVHPVRNLETLKGQEIEVRVIKLNKKRGNIVVSRKAILDEEIVSKRGKTLENLHEEAILTGTVKNLTDYGAFVELEQGIEGLVHVSEMSWSKRMKHPSKLVIVANEIECVVLNVNSNERRISLGLKQLESNPWESLHEKYPLGSTVEGRVRNLTDFGAFIEIEDGIDGLVHVSNLSWTKRVKHPSEVLKKGEKVKAIVLGIEPEQRRLSLGVKQLQPDAWETFFASHRIGDVVHGKVLRLAQFGAFVEIAEGVEGLCHNSEATDANGTTMQLEAGQEHDFKIIKMNQEEKKVGLSLRAVGEEASRADVEAYKRPASSSSSTTTLGDIINWKRAGNDQD